MSAFHGKLLFSSVQKAALLLSGCLRNTAAA
jgi:hypothetical protein